MLFFVCFVFLKLIFNTRLFIASRKPIQTHLVFENESYNMNGAVSFDTAAFTFKIGGAQIFTLCTECFEWTHLICPYLSLEVFNFIQRYHRLPAPTFSRHCQKVVQFFKLNNIFCHSEFNRPHLKFNVKSNSQRNQN